MNLPNWRLIYHWNGIRMRLFESQSTLLTQRARSSFLLTVLLLIFFSTLIIKAFLKICLFSPTFLNTPSPPFLSALSAPSKPTHEAKTNFHNTIYIALSCCVGSSVTELRIGSLLILGWKGGRVRIKVLRDIFLFVFVFVFLYLYLILYLFVLVGGRLAPRANTSSRKSFISVAREINKSSTFNKPRLRRI